MVLGINEGKIDVVLNQQAYNYNESIRGHCKLKLKKPTEARGLIAVFRRWDSRGGESIHLIDIERKELGAKRTYKNGEEFDFSFVMNEKAYPPNFKFNGLTGMLQKILGPPDATSRWFVYVFLDRPLKFPISGEVLPKINVPEIKK
jgi:hypothetical protein